MDPERYELDLPESEYVRGPRVELCSGVPTTVAPGGTEPGHKPSLVGVESAVVSRTRNGQFVTTHQATYRISPLNTVTASAAIVGKSQRTVTGTTLVLGAHQPIFNNYGHFLADQLPAFWFEQDLQRLGCSRVAVLGVRSALLRARIRELIDRYSSIDVEVEFHEFGATRFEHALFPQGLSDHPRMKSVALERLIRSKAPMQESAVALRLFVSRADAGDRLLANERELEAVLADCGFRTVRGSQLSIAESVDVFSKAEAVVGVTGAAVANIIHCRAGTPVINIGPNDMNGFWYYDLACLFGLRFFDFHAPRVAAVPRDRPRSSGDFQLDVATYQRAHAAVFGAG